MKKLILLTLSLLCMGQMAAQKKEKYVLTGEMTRDSLRFTRKAIDKLYLVCYRDGEEIKIDSAVVKNKRFRFEGTVPAGYEAYFLTGFDNGSIQFFLEPGNIVVNPFDAHFPVGAVVSGTPNNDVLAGFQATTKEAIARSRSKAADRGDEAMLQSMDKETRLGHDNAIFFQNSLLMKTEAMKYVRKHLDKPAALFLMRYELYHLFSPRVVERQLLRSLSPSLHSHPLYKEMLNLVRAADLKEGNLAPDIAGFTPEGKEIKLSDLQGKYVLLDVWASWCGPCRREFPFLQQAMKVSEAHNNFVILSYSIDNKKQEWVDCIAKNNLVHANWLHISTLKGWKSDVATLFAIKGVPYTVLLNPKGQVVAFNLRGEEMLEKVTRIMEGTESYE